MTITGPTCSGSGVVVTRGAPSQRTHCPKGHEYTAENTYYRPGTNWRECRQCKRDYAERARGGGAGGDRMTSRAESRYRIDEAVFLFDQGEHPAHIAAQLGVPVATLAAGLRSRADRRDVLGAFERERWHVAQQRRKGVAA